MEELNYHLNCISFDFRAKKCGVFPISAKKQDRYFRNTHLPHFGDALFFPLLFLPPSKLFSSLRRRCVVFLPWSNNCPERFKCLVWISKWDRGEGGRGRWWWCKQVKILYWIFLTRVHSQGDWTSATSLDVEFTFVDLFPRHLKRISQLQQHIWCIQHNGHVGLHNRSTRTNSSNRVDKKWLTFNFTLFSSRRVNFENVMNYQLNAMVYLLCITTIQLI